MKFFCKTSENLVGFDTIIKLTELWSNCIQNYNFLEENSIENLHCFIKYGHAERFNVLYESQIQKVKYIETLFGKNIKVSINFKLKIKISI